MSRSMRLESGFQDKVIKELKELYPEAIITKLERPQGIPDILMLYKDKWASLECKREKDAKRQPNQEYYVNRMNEMSFSRFIYPENKEEVFDALQRAFSSGG